MKKKIVLYIVTGLCCVSSFAQTRDIKKGDEAFAEKTYATAKEYYMNAYDVAKSNGNNDQMAYTSYKIAECFYEANNFERAIPFYKNAVDLKYQDTSKTLYRHYGDMLMMIGDYALAREMYDKQLIVNQNDELTKMHLKACDFIDTAQTFESMYEVQNVQQINTRYSDFAPSKCKLNVVFTTSRFSKDSLVYTYTGDGFEDLYESYCNEEQRTWSPVEKLKGGINSSYNDGTFTFDIRNNVAYFMQCNGLSGADKNCNIYLSKYDDNNAEWGKPTPFTYYAKEYSSGHPALTPDGLTLYFASNNPAGLGGTDIWMCHRDSANSDNWSAPQNVGSAVNTADDEMFPFVNDNNGLYFSSNGHPGYGGLDLFYAAKNGSSFSTPINLRPPFNSSGDDFSLLYLSENSGLFASNRVGGVGSDDIYYFTLKEVTIAVSGRVISTDSLPLSEALVLIKNVQTEQVDTLVTDAEGRYYFEAMSPDAEYKLFAHKTSYLNPDGKLINTKGVTQSIVMDSINGFDMNFVLQKIEKNKEYEIRDIYYDLDKYELRPASVTELNTLVAVLNNNPDIYIQINSHTDERASDSYNLILSNNRAKAVVDYLVSQGIDDKRLTWKGWGETNPIFKNATTEEEHQSNRRTTFSIINYDELQLKKQEEQQKDAIERLESTGKQAPREQGICFRLQIGASKNKSNSKIYSKLDDAHKKLPTYCTKESDDLYHFTIGSFKNFADATKVKDEIDALGYNSFVVAYENGTRISIHEALQKIQTTKKANK